MLPRGMGPFSPFPANSQKRRPSRQPPHGRIFLGAAERPRARTAIRPRRPPSRPPWRPRQGIALPAPKKGPRTALRKPLVQARRIFARASPGHCTPDLRPCFPGFGLAPEFFRHASPGRRTPVLRPCFARLALSRRFSRRASPGSCMSIVLIPINRVRQSPTGTRCLNSRRRSPPPAAGGWCPIIGTPKLGC